MIRVVKVAGFLVSLALMGVWVWFSWELVGWALDYPIRRAGETVFGYPPRDTFAFYWNCTIVLAEAFLMMSPIWAAPLALALFAFFRSCSLRSTTMRIIITSVVLFGPIVGSAVYNIFFYYGT